MDRLIYRAHISGPDNNAHDLRVVANENGLLRIYLTGISRALSYAGIKENDLPATVAEGGGTNAAIARRVANAVQRGHHIMDDWVEPENTQAAASTRTPFHRINIESNIASGKGRARSNTCRP